MGFGAAEGRTHTHTHTHPLSYLSDRLFGKMKIFGSVLPSCYGMSCRAVPSDPLARLIMTDEREQKKKPLTNGVTVERNAMRGGRVFACSYLQYPSC